MKQVYIVFLCMVFVGGCWAQSTHDSIQWLQEVIVTADKNLKSYTNTQKITELRDSLVSRSGASLTDLLQANTSIYFRENGLGMVSSASFRGTTAQQTAVVWNGININSQFSGQTDFNTINIRNFDQIVVRSGGGSVLYGSGAIGGSIHLVNTLEFNQGFENQVLLKHGSFNTQDASYHGSFSNKKFSVNVSASYLHSDNDFSYVDSDRENLNGQFYNVGLSANFGYVLSDNHKLKFYSYSYDGERHFSLILPTETPTKYQDINSRNMLEWEGRFGKIQSNLKVAYLSERYKYFANMGSEEYTYGDAQTWIGKYQLALQPFSGATLKGVADITQTTGEGSSIEQVERTISGFSMLYKHRIQKFLYEATLRKEITQNYESPFLYSLGLNYQFSSWYRLRVHGSKNFRIPTYNDLYWAGSGNQDLKPENSYQLEIGNEFQYQFLKFSFAGFYMDITDMIRWLPVGSMWQPVNTDKVLSYGLETELTLDKTFGSHHFILNGNYSYTKSQNQETEKQLIYVPYHKAFGGFNYAFKNLSLYWQSIYTGEVFILSDNNPRYVIDAYTVHHFGAEFNLNASKSWVIGTQVRNLLNENYQSVDNRFMPGRHYNFYLNFNF